MPDFKAGSSAIQAERYRRGSYTLGVDIRLIFSRVRASSILELALIFPQNVENEECRE